MDIDDMDGDLFDSHISLKCIKCGSLGAIGIDNVIVAMAICISCGATMSPYQPVYNPGESPEASATYYISKSKDWAKL